MNDCGRKGHSRKREQLHGSSRCLRVRLPSRNSDPRTAFFLLLPGIHKLSFYILLMDRARGLASSFHH
jgi:hypothetical protein